MYSYFRTPEIPGGLKASEFFADRPDEITDTLQHYQKRDIAARMPSDEDPIHQVSIVRANFWRPMSRGDGKDVHVIEIGDDIKLEATLNAIPDLKRYIAQSRTGENRRGALYKFTESPHGLVFLPESVVKKLQTYDLTHLDREIEKELAQEHALLDQANAAAMDDPKRLERQRHGLVYRILSALRVV